MKKPQPETELSIIILTYNSANELPNCLGSLYEFNREKLLSGEWEVIVIDNNSTDQTILNLEKNRGAYPNLVIRKNQDNLGFGAGNNAAAKEARGNYLLFLNPDTVVENDSMSLPLDYLKHHPDTGAVSVKLLLGNGQIDMTCHRGFPTPWNSFCYFSGLTRIFPRSRLFAGYTLGNKDLSSSHQVDAINGAFFMMPRALGQTLGFFDEAFYWKGEDLDLCYRLVQKGFKVMYLPQAVVHHFKGAPGGHKRVSKTLQARFAVTQLI